MDKDIRLRRTAFRASHRGTREADMMIGGFFARYGHTWGDAEYAWFDRLLDEQDVDIMAWGLGRQEVPEEFRGELMDLFCKLDFIELPRGLKPDDADSPEG